VVSAPPGVILNTVPGCAPPPYRFVPWKLPSVKRRYRTWYVIRNRMPTLLRFLFTVLILGHTALPAAAQSQQPSRWELYTQSGSGRRPDSGHEVCRPLDYFSGSPLLFDYEHGVDPSFETTRTPIECSEGGLVCRNGGLPGNLS